MVEQSSSKYLLDRLIKVRFVYAEKATNYEENLKLWNERLAAYNLLVGTEYSEDSETYKWLTKEYEYFQNNKEPTPETSDETGTNYYDIDLSPSTGGPKPDITLEVSILPGGLFQGCTVTVNNYNCPWDIHNYKRMEVTAGYVVLNDKGEREEVARTFGIDIFYSYCKSPAPDSETVFKGIIVDKLVTSTTSFFNMKLHYLLEVYGTVTLRNLVNACMTLINKSMENLGNSYRISAIFDQSLEAIEGFLDYKIDMRYRYLEFSSIMDILKYLSAQIAKIGKSLKLENGTILNTQCVYRGNDFYVFPVNGAYSNNEVKYKLTSISSATLNAGIMTVNAPWYPPVTPGDLIEVSREYIDGSEFPNFLADSEVVSKDNLYRVITMDIQFSSTRNLNNMKITAIPQRFISEDSAKLLSSAEEFQDKYDLLYEEGKEKVYRFKGVIGDKGKDNELIKYAKQNKSTIQGYTQFSAGTIGTRQKGKYAKADIMDIAKANYSQLGMLRCPDTLKGSSSITKDGTKFKEYGPEYIWPIIYILTFYKYENDGVSPNDFSKLFIGKGTETLNHTFERNDSYFLPAVSGWADLKVIADMYDYVVTVYLDNKLKDLPKGTAADYKNIYLYLRNL